MLDFVPLKFEGQHVVSQLKFGLKLCFLEWGTGFYSESLLRKTIFLENLITAYFLYT